MSTNYIDQITDTAGTTQDISESDSTRIFRATCSTSASTAAKVATLQTSNKNFSLTAGVRVAVTFTYGNSATTPTLRVDGSSTGTAKTIVFPTAVATKSTGNGTTYNTWGPYETIVFTYDGTYWVNSGSALGIYNAYALANSKGSGTVTSVGITNGGGLSISGSPITTSGSITVSHSNSVTAQTTQAVYPIKIDAQGHVSGYGSAVTIPTKTSDLTNDSGYITSYTDEKLKIEAVTSGYVYYPILTRDSTSAAVRQYDVTGLKYNNTNGTAESLGKSELVLGNSTASGSVNNKHGVLSIYGDGSNYFSLRGNPTSNRSINFPDKSGTVALTSDIPVNTDEKLKTTQANAGSVYYSIVGGSSTSAETKYYNPYITSSYTSGNANLYIGEGSHWGNLYIEKGNYNNCLYTMALTASRMIGLPDKSGTVALTSDVPSIQIVRW